MGDRRRGALRRRHAAARVQREPLPARCSAPIRRTRTAEPRPGHQPRDGRVVAHTYFSRRFGYVEPYSGLLVHADFAQASSDFGERNNDRARSSTTRRSSARSCRARGHPVGAPRAVPAPRRRLPLRRDVPLGRARLLGALRRARLVAGALAPLAEPGRYNRTASPTRCNSVPRRRGRPDVPGVLHRHHRPAGVRQLRVHGSADVAGRRVHEVRRSGSGSRTSSRTSSRRPTRATRTSASRTSAARARRSSRRTRRRRRASPTRTTATSSTSPATASPSTTRRSWTSRSAAS